MDLDDSFSERLLQKARARKEYINEKKTEFFTGKKRAALVEEHQVNSDEPPEESPKRQCTEVLQTAYSSYDKENIRMIDDDSLADFVPYHLASRSRGLAALKKKFPDGHDGANSNSAEQVNKSDTYVFSTNSSELCANPKQKSRFADLAANIRQWEDDTDTHRPTLSSKNVTSSNTTKFHMPSTTATNSASENTFSVKLVYTNKHPSDSINSGKHGDGNSRNCTSASSSTGRGSAGTVSPCKKGNIAVGSVKEKWGKFQAWEQAVSATLNTPTSMIYPKENASKVESEGMQPDFAEESSDGESIDESDFAEDYHGFKTDDGNSKMEVDFSPVKEVQQQQCWNEPEKPETSKKQNLPDVEKVLNTSLDPAELPLFARRALFEKALLNGSPKVNEDIVDQKLSVAQRAAMFENASKGNSRAKAAAVKEPKRIAFSNFEKFENKSTSVPRSPIKMVQSTAKADLQDIKASPVKRITQESAMSPIKHGLGSCASPVKMPGPGSCNSPVKKTGLGSASPIKKNGPGSSASPAKTSGLGAASPVKNIGSGSGASPVKNVGNHTRLMQQKLFESSGSNSQERQTAKAVEERKKEISSLVNRWEKLSSSSSVESNSEKVGCSLASDEKYSESDAGQEDVGESEAEYEANDSDNEEEFNRAEGKNYNDDESAYDNDCSNEQEEVETEGQDDTRCSFEKQEILQSDFHIEETDTESVTSLDEISKSKQNSGLTKHESYQPTRSVKSSFSYSGMSSYTDDSNHVTSSRSCNSGSSVRSYDVTNPQVEDVFQEPSTVRENKNPEINILRTVSTYRREKQETKLTPVRTVVRQEKVSSPESPPDTDLTEVIQQRLKDLQNEILRQQTVISQTSQALNLCSATAEFSGSTEQVEGERLLLIATQKRQACLNEITRLKTCGAQNEIIADGKGTLTITDLQLPLKREFITAQLEGRGNDTVHYFLCLIRHGAQVIVTQMMSTDDKTKDGTLHFTNHIQLRNLPADFSVVFEVYALQTKKDVVPHEKKYHIKRENSKRRLTPKGKKGDGKILLPAVSSPGGPNAVRSPSFGVVGYTRFTLHNCNKKAFTLDKVPFTSPLEGVLRVQLQLHAEHKVVLKGFLTFYEDVGNTGALYRRWCVLDVNQISYWVYPDDEHKKEPIGIIDLKRCVTGEVKSVSTLECARSHTFKLVTVRPQKKGEKDTLISRTINTLTTTKHLLTADSKDERILWCNKINEALSNVRKWDPEALRPIEAIQI